MKISVNWLKEYTDVDLSIDELVQKIGAQLGEVEQVEHLGKKYEGIVVVKVVRCTPHPDADKLTTCMIDDGSVVKNIARDKKGLVQVVCGAPNVREGMLATWIPPGATVPATFDKDPFEVDTRKLRGQNSSGMLASPSELAIGNDHSGLLEIDVKAKPGQPLAEVYGLDDYIVEIENKSFTHRPDLFGLLGVAREVAGITHKPFKTPSWYKKDKAGSARQADPQLKVVNEVPQLVPRFMAQVIEDIQVNPSPINMQIKLNNVGIKPINDIVDITNYLMYLTGQPLHAYDYDKVAAKCKGQPTLKIRTAKAGEELKILGGKTLELDEDTIVIATDREAIGIGGVIGGADTEVDDSTINIILECANFDLYSIRRTSMRLGLFTDAVTRFSKGQNTVQNDRVLAEAAKKVADLADGSPSRSVHDLQAKPQVHPTLTTDIDFINSRLGSDFSAKQIASLLANVEFSVKTRGNTMHITPPFWRTDIAIPEDVVEEVGRLHGYDHLPLELPAKPMNPSVIDEQLQIKKMLRTKLAALGANETLNYSFVHADLLEKSGQDQAQAFQLKNALSPDLQYYRLSLTPSLLDKVHPNIKSGNKSFALFEIGKVHGKSESDEEGLPKEFGRVALVVASDIKSGLKADYFLAKHYTENLLGSRGQLSYKSFAEAKLVGHKLAEQLLAPFEPKRSSIVYAGDRLAGVVGEYKPAVRRQLKLPGQTAGFELFLSPFTGRTSAVYRTLSRYPSTDQDICLKTSLSLAYSQIQSSLQESLAGHAPNHVDITLQPIDIFSKDKAHKQTTFRVVATSSQQTLTTEMLSSMLDKTAADLEKQIKAERI